MVCYCLDLRSDSKVGKFLGNKLVSILTGLVQFVLWFSVLLNYIIQPNYVKDQIDNMDTASLVMSILLTIVINIFSGILLFGLFKDREGYVKCYLIFNVVLTVIFILSFFVTLFTNPTKMGVGGYIGVILIIMLNILFFFIIRNYYLSFQMKKSARNPA